jgi:preprotein translocase subunit SecE
VAESKDTADDVRAGSTSAPPVKREARGNPFARLVRFFREVVAELRKVIWPTRKELLTYTAVVVVFVAIMVAIVAGLDVAFAKAVAFMFGRNA